MWNRNLSLNYKCDVKNKWTISRNSEKKMTKWRIYDPLMLQE